MTQLSLLDGGRDLPETPVATLDAQTIARALGQHPPTPEQQAVIEAPPSPLLVVAGAGSGKTETMSARVVWLVANGLAAPDQVLGLTFTRKAAGELAERVRVRLRRLRASGLWTPGDDGDVAEPSISTYHSFAGRLVGEHALRLGVEPEARLLTEAAAWQYASEVVERWTGEMSAVSQAASTVTEAVLALAGECSEHLVAPEDVADHLAALAAQVEALEYGGTKPRAGKRAEVARLLANLEARRQLVPVVRAYLELKRTREALDFGDQVALAARLARDVPAIGEQERARFTAVLLDEYQDTSHAQLVMLSSLFGGGHGVTAVGDPHQSIYGWRGASAGTLERFAEVFTDVEGRGARVAHLSTSWRNDRLVLDAANVVAAPLPGGDRVAVRRLAARPDAGPGRVSVGRWDTVEQEAQAVAGWVAQRWWTPSRERTGRTAAVLCRKRAQFVAVEHALRERGLPVEVVGLGGLLATPEVADVVAALHAVHDPGRGDMLVRLLTGPLVRLGPRDLVGLAAWARDLQRRAGSRAATSGTELPETVDEASIVEALDELPRRGWRDGQGRGLSDAALARLQELSDLLRGLRSATALPLPELVGAVERALRLDVEVAARSGADPAVSRAHLDAFAEVAASFAATADHSTLGAFLAWLDAAETRERGLEPGKVDVTDEAVQLLTVHAAKGLEWDVVAVPGLVEGTFPATTAKVRATDDGWVLGADSDRGWLTGLGSLPYALRGDADQLPVLRLDDCADQKDLLDEVADLAARGGAHAVAEERRLAYVALTRARSDLLLSAHVWGDAVAPRLARRFLEEVLADEHLAAHVVRGPWADLPPTAPAPGEPPVANPRSAQVLSKQWPYDPLGARRPEVEAGAARVRAARAADPAALLAGPARTVDGERWRWEAQALLAERDRGRDADVEVVLPANLSASRLVRLAADPDAVALEVRRPMPTPPSPAARRGTAFHAWVEQHLGAAAIVDVLDLPGSADEDPAPDSELDAMRERFLASEWAGRTAVAVEVPVETPVAGTVVRGRVDAVLRRPDGGVDVVDWKTGAEPPPGQEAARAVQLAAYRLAWSRLTGTPLEKVGAAFFYAATGRTVRPVDLLGEADLVALLESVPRHVPPGLVGPAGSGDEAPGPVGSHH